MRKGKVTHKEERQHSQAQAEALEPAWRELIPPHIDNFSLQHITDSLQFVDHKALLLELEANNSEQQPGTKQNIWNFNNQSTKKRTIHRNNSVSNQTELRTRAT